MGPCTFTIISLRILLRRRNVSDKRYIEIQNICFMLINFFPPKCLPFMRMWENTVHTDRPQMTIWRLRISCCVTKATDTEYVILTAFPLQQWLHERSPLLRYTYIVCLVASSCKGKFLVKSNKNCMHVCTYLKNCC